MTILTIQKYWGEVVRPNFVRATQTGDFSWECPEENLWHFQQEVLDMPKEGPQGLVRRRLLGALNQAMKWTTGWQCPEWQAWKEEQDRVEKLKRIEEEEQRKHYRWQQQCWSQSAYNIKHYGDANPWR